MPDLWFSPGTDLSRVVCQHIDRCSVSVFAASFLGPDERIAASLAAAVRRGCDVKVAVDGSTLRNNPIDNISSLVPIRGVLTMGGTMHHKFVILDRGGVLTGSFNLSSNSKSFNLLTLLGGTYVGRFQLEADRIWSLPDAQPLLLPWQAEVLLRAVTKCSGPAAYLTQIATRCRARGWLTAGEEAALRRALDKKKRSHPEIPTLAPGADKTLGW